MMRILIANIIAIAAVVAIAAAASDEEPVGPVGPRRSAQALDGGTHLRTRASGGDDHGRHQRRSSRTEGEEE